MHKTSIIYFMLNSNTIQFTYYVGDIFIIMLTYTYFCDLFI
jgi:hypothetical protein